MDHATDIGIIPNSKNFLVWPFIILIICLVLQTNHVAGQTIQGIPCKGEIKYFANQKLNSCTLSQNAAIEGYELPADSKVFFKKEGNLDLCILSKETVVTGQSLPAKTAVFFNNWGEKVSIWLPEMTMMQGHLLAAGGNGPGIPLYPNGRLKEIWLQKDEWIDSIPCTTSGNPFRYGWQAVRLGTERRVKFYDNGHLKQAMLFRDITVQGHPFKKGELIQLDESGKIKLNHLN